jgi:hypothetical protein
MKVRFEFFREYVGEIVLALPKKISKANLVAILTEVESHHGFDQFAWDNEYNVEGSVSVLECETIEGGQADADFVVTRGENWWTIAEAAAR